MSQPHLETKAGTSSAAYPLHWQLSYETARRIYFASDNKTLGKQHNDPYLIVEHNFFIILLLIAHVFTLTTQPISSPLSFDAFSMRLLCAMSTSLLQSVT
jgi:hypothetical protein